ncbi:MAG TPA: hypothetical protein PLZ16_11050 [Gammaproteobacteria bacterium]|nr:hypothetical protein [Gammaproteobacteria bacterium]
MPCKALFFLCREPANDARLTDRQRTEPGGRCQPAITAGSGAAAGRPGPWRAEKIRGELRFKTGVRLHRHGSGGSVCGQRESWQQRQCTGSTMTGCTTLSITAGIPVAPFTILNRSMFSRNESAIMVGRHLNDAFWLAREIDQTRHRALQWSQPHKEGKQNSQLFLNRSAHAARYYRDSS